MDAYRRYKFIGSEPKNKTNKNANNKKTNIHNTAIAWASCLGWFPLAHNSYSESPRGQLLCDHTQPSPSVFQKREEARCPAFAAEESIVFSMWQETRLAPVWENTVYSRLPMIHTSLENCSGAKKAIVPLLKRYLRSVVSHSKRPPSSPPDMWGKDLCWIVLYQPDPS